MGFGSEAGYVCAQHGVGDVIANSIIAPLAPDGTFQLYTYASDDFRIVRVEVNCPGGELRTDQVVLGALETLGFEVNCPGLHAGGATIRALVDL